MVRRCKDDAARRAGRLRGDRCALAVCLLAFGLSSRPGLALDADWPPIRAIEFSGNDTTEPETMLREMSVVVGDPADPRAIERSRQAIQDLGLFNAVRVETFPEGDGVRLQFQVREKWYLLPLPRIEGNPDGDYGYGAELRWNNVLGLNHTAKLLIVKRSYSDASRQGQLSVSGSYRMPFFDVGALRSRNGLAFSGGHVAQDSLDAQHRHYDETIDRAEVLALHSFETMPSSLGWSLGAGLRWQQQFTAGQFAPPSEGAATALVATVNYNRLHYLIFSEEGEAYGARLELAQDGWLSDYGYSQITAQYRRAWQIGSTPHQELQLLASTGSYFGGAPSRPREQFSVGGASLLQGYGSDHLQGDFYYHAAGEYLRPLGWNWLRGFVFLDAGSAYHGPTQTGARPVLASLGLGLRLRVNWLVSLELQLGVALPLVDGHGPRVFAGTL